MARLGKAERNAIGEALEDWLSDRSDEEMKQPRFQAAKRAHTKLFGTDWD